MEPYIPNKYLTTPQRIHVIDRSVMLDQTVPQIKLAIGIPISTIRRTLKFGVSRHNKNLISRTSEKINARDLRSLIRAVISGPDGRRENYMSLVADLGITACEIIVRKYLRKAGFRRCIACFKPLVSWINRRKRLKWARAHLHWTIEDWMRVIFTDESSFETGKRNRIFITRRSDERHCSDYCQNFKHSGRQSLMVWGGFCGDQASELCQLPGSIKLTKRGPMKRSLRKSITSTDYIEQILQPHVLPWYRALERMGRRPIFMQDGAGIHDSKETMLWLRQHRIETLEWPPSSPDLNPDEYMWKCCKQKIQGYKRMILTSQDMWPAATYEWNQLVEREAYIKWVKSMPERCRDVIKNRGFSTKW